MEFVRISSWTMRAALLLTLLLAIHFHQEQAVEAAPVFEDYAENQPSLYELLLQRELMADKMDSSDGRGHMVVRKSDRSPSLRLRFGRSADPGVLRLPSQ